MKKIVLALIVFSIICMVLTGCIHWETSVDYKLLHDTSQIQSIRIYKTKSGIGYNYSDPIDPCSALLGEISSDQVADFVEELTALPFTESHLILLFPAAVDPNFYYGNHIVKVEYLDGSCELISYCIQRQFPLNEKYPDTTRYGTENEQWLDFLQNWVDISDQN